MKTLKLLASLMILGCAFTVAAQTPQAEGQAPPVDMKEKFAQAQKENQAALQRFTWKSRTELMLKGESKKVKVEQVRYGADGQQQKITIEESSPQPQEQGGGGRRGARVKQKVIENKKEEFGELMQNLVVVATSYTHIPPDKMQAFLKNAQISLGKAPYEGTLQITGTGALTPEDSLTFWIDKQSLTFRRIEINTVLDKKPVHMVAEYTQMTNGPSFMSRATLDYPEKEIHVTVDNYDHQQI